MGRFDALGTISYGPREGELPSLVFRRSLFVVEDVARRLKMTPNAVYGAKRRVLARIKEIQPFVEDVW